LGFSPSPTSDAAPSFKHLQSTSLDEERPLRPSDPPRSASNGGYRPLHKDSIPRWDLGDTTTKGALHGHVRIKITYQQYEQYEQYYASPPARKNACPTAHTRLTRFSRLEIPCHLPNVFFNALIRASSRSDPATFSSA
jgi:hypothetical protein